jgi:serine/threonine-protein kinase
MNMVAKLGVEEWHRLNRLLEQALDLEECDRPAWLERQDRLDPQLQEVLRSLLEQASHESSELIETASWALPEARPGDRIGPYRLVRELARGGMGVVWVAERADGSFERQVALKLPRAEWTAPGLAQRMARERAILASLSHPHIAQLYDAGWTDDHRPFIALELVDGTPIDAYCTEKRLSVSERVALFVDVAQAVAFAHSRLVVHRDLKPSNVMVSRDGSVKLLDFGIAKLLVGDNLAGEESVVTRAGERALTTAYAPPEQILGRPVSAASDVYSLGVMLYELISGVRPYRPTTASSSAALEEAILNVEPLAPSRAGNRTDERVRGDLDTIVLKALKKQPEARYESAAALADDLDRYLAHRPIRARPDSRRYRARLFLKRHRFPLGIAAGVFAALLVSSIVSLWQAQTAREEARRAAAIKDFLLALIRQADPMASAATRESDVPLLSAAEERIATEVAGQPEVTIELRLAIADAFANRGMMDRARATLRTAISEGQHVLEPDNAALAHARIKAAQNFVHVGEDVLQQLDQGIATARSLGSRGQRMLVEGLLNRAAVRSWSSMSTQFETDIREAYELARTALGPGDPLTLQVACSLAWPSPIEVDGLKIISEAYQAGRANPMVGEAHPALLRAQVLYGYHLARSGQLDTALTMVRSAIATARRHHGVGRPTEEVLTAAQLAFHGARQLDAYFEAAIEAHRLAAARHAGGEPVVGLRAMNLLSAMINTRRVDGSDTLMPTNGGMLENRRMREAARLLSQSMQANVLLLKGRTVEAEALLAEGVAGLEERSIHNHFNARIPLGWALRENGQPERSIEVLRAVVAAKLVFDVDGQTLLNQLAASHLALGRPAEALGFARQAVEFEKSLAPFAPDGAEAFLVQGRALLELGRVLEAADSLAIADTFWRSFDPETAWAAEAAYWYGRALIEAGDAARGTELVNRALPVLKLSPMPSHRALAASVTS